MAGVAGSGRDWLELSLGDRGGRVRTMGAGVARDDRGWPGIFRGWPEMAGDFPGMAGDGRDGPRSSVAVRDYERKAQSALRFFYWCSRYWQIEFVLKHNEMNPLL